jgi:hypothetical protein
MLNVDRVWSRVSQLPGFKGKRLADFILQVINLNFTLTTQQVSAQTPVNLPAGMVLLGVIGAARLSAVAATQTSSPGLDLFRVAIDYQATSRSIVGPGTRGLGSAVFGPFGDQFPGKELVVPIQGSLLYTVENATTSTIEVTFAHAGLVPSAVG